MPSMPEEEGEAPGEHDAAQGNEEASAREARPFQGEELGGAAAAICPGFDPEPLRYIMHQPGMRIILIFGLIVGALMAGCFAGGYALRAPRGGWWPGILTALLYLVGLLLAFLEPIVVVLLGMGYAAAARYFKNALLTPGVIVSEKPLALAILAPLGNGSGPDYHGIQRLNVSGLPYHAHTAGTRVPVVSAFQPAEGLDRWLSFSPDPVCWGTGNRAQIDQCFDRLGPEPFEDLDACIARGLVPRDEDELILLDAQFKELARFSIKEEKKKYAPATESGEGS